MGDDRPRNTRMLGGERHRGDIDVPALLGGRSGAAPGPTADTAGLEMTSRKRPLSEPISYFVGAGALRRVKLAACIFQEPLSRFST
jgi:hypothetical protein